MPRKYKHIRIPARLVGSASPYSTTSGPNIQDLLPLTEQQDEQRKNRIARGLAAVEAYESSSEEGEQTSTDAQESGFYELRMSLRRSSNNDLLKRLNIEPYVKFEKTHKLQSGRKLKEYKEETVLGKVTTTKLRGQRESNFDRLKRELSEYVEDDKLPSYFDKILDIKPLTIQELAEEGLLEDLESENRLLVDFVFGDNAEVSELKMSSLKETYGDAFLLEVNTELNHYCRMSISKAETEAIVNEHKGIIEITHAPVFVPSQGRVVDSGEIEPTDSTTDEINPILIADKPVNGSHPLLQAVFVDQIGDTTDSATHGTEVASLAVYGRKLPIRGAAEQRNKVIGVTATIKDPATGLETLNETLIQDAVETYQSTSRSLIVNLSMNDHNRNYDRQFVHHITNFLDELTHRYNCIFTISAGNMNEVNDFYAAGLAYPQYFNEDKTTIFAPADSINNITVGSITYQESADSIAELENPSPITRRGFEEKKFGFIKPDLVHFDSNCVLNNNLVEAEHNGPNLATGTDSVTKNIGTSFAAPLVAHELGILASSYPSYRAQTLKALIMHFSQMPSNLPQAMQPERVTSLLGHGQTRIDTTLNSLNTSSTMVIEDEIKIDSSKPIEIPIPRSLAGSRNLRLRMRLTIAYSPKPNGKDASCYCPINVSAYVRREDGYKVSNATTQSYINGAHRKSNLKKYSSIEKNTLQHTGDFWNVVVAAEAMGDFLPENYMQPYSMIVTIEDIDKDDNLDIHQEISQMIEVRAETTIDISV